MRKKSFTLIKPPDEYVLGNFQQQQKNNGQNVRDVPSNKWSRLSVDFLLENLLIDNIKEICFLQSTKGSDPSLWYLQIARVNRNRCGTATSIR